MNILPLCLAHGGWAHGGRKAVAPDGAALQHWGLGYGGKNGCAHASDPDHKLRHHAAQPIVCGDVRIVLDQGTFKPDRAWPHPSLVSNV